MKCTLPEADRSGWQNEEYYEDYISELWEVLKLVEQLRINERGIEDMRRRKVQVDGEKWMEMHDEVKRLRKEIDEWFDTYNESEQ